MYAGKFRHDYILVLEYKSIRPPTLSSAKLDTATSILNQLRSHQIRSETQGYEATCVDTAV
jgi:hypothetical protein